MATCGSIAAKENWLICGPTGVGKSHLATAISYEAIRRGMKVLSFSAQCRPRPEGELPLLAPPKQQVPAVRPPPAALGALAAISTGLLWAGGRMLVDGNEAARYHEWVLNTRLPLDAPCPRKGDPSAVPPSQRCVRLTTAWAVVLLLCGLMILWLSVRAFLSL